MNALKAGWEDHKRIAESQLEAASQVLIRWQLDDESAQARHLIECAIRESGSGNYPKAEEIANQASAIVEGATARAVAYEEAHERRMYVLSGLWKVMTDMGFLVPVDPALEDENDLRSRVVFRVDALSKGMVTFYISLEGVESDSCISERFCLRDFDQMSKQLAAEFGVNTKFRGEDTLATPIELAVVEDELPNAAVVEQMY